MVRLSFLLALLSSSALAQQPPSTPEAQALGAEIMAQLNAKLQCGTALITSQQALERAQAEIKRLTDKYEPKEAPK